ncbi:MAG: hypothetical protein IJC39_01345 [Firmicutes bacterium]|nr:hypothetical protein [Bacillota bacterium]
MKCGSGYEKISKEDNEGIMEMKKRRKSIIVMGILSLLLAGFTGCGKGGDQGTDPSNEALSAIEKEVTPMELPEEAGLKHFFITHQGMAAGAYYILKTTDAGTYMKISDVSPDNIWMTEGEDMDSLGEKAEYLGFADTVKDCERASLVLLEDDGPIRALEKAIADTGALGWDGFNKEVAMPDVADSGDRYRLYLELTDGTAVTVDSYNAKTAGFLELLRQAEEIFHANKDYSRYYIEDFDTAECTNLYVCFRQAFHKGEWRLELRNSDKNAIVVLEDPDGLFTQAGTNIAESIPIEGEIPFERFLDIFKKHEALRWSDYEGSDGNSKESFDIRLYFEDGKEFVMSGSLLPEGFDEFRKEFIEEISLFYNEQKL